MIKYGIILGVFSTVLSIIALNVLGDTSIAIPMSIGIFCGTIMTFWFVRSYKRMPEKKEFKIITGTYAVFMLIVSFVPILIADNYTIPGLISLGMISIAYGCFFSLVFNKKIVSTQLQKVHDKDHKE